MKFDKRGYGNRGLVMKFEQEVMVIEVFRERPLYFEKEAADDFDFDDVFISLLLFLNFLFLFFNKLNSH